MHLFTSTSRHENMHSLDLSSRSTTNLTGENYSHDTEDSLKQVGYFGAGIFDDFKRRSYFFLSDFTDAISPKTLSASAFMFFATVFSTIALGSHLQSSSGGYVGVQEYLLMNGVSGILFALFSPQPLMILRPTGPITLILENLLSVSVSFDINFWHLLAYSGYFVGLYLALLSGLEVSNLTQQLTRFTYEIFGCYVCSVYIFSGVKGVLTSFAAETYTSSGDDGNGSEVSASYVMASALFVLIIATLTLTLSLVLSSCARSPEANTTWTERNDPSSDSADSTHNMSPCQWTVCTPSIRAFISDYAVTLAVLMATALSYLPYAYGLTSATSGDAALHVDRVEIPLTSFPPTPTFQSSSADGDGRSTWLVDFTTGEYGHSAWRTASISALVALPIAFFFFIDQSLSALLSQQPHMEGMRKGVYLHGPLALVAVFNAVGPSFGLPFVTASLPHSPQLVNALTSAHTSSYESPKVTTCSENRVAPLLVYTVILGVATLPVLTPLIRCMPTGAVRGVLIYVGVAGITHTQLYHRVIALFQLPSVVESGCGHGVLTSGRVHCFTALQLCILAVFWVLNLSPSPAGLAVAFLVAALGPMRQWLLPKIFSDVELSTLDAGY